jgi:hypothetical protein
MNIKTTTAVRLPLGGEINKLEITVNAFTLFPSSISVTWKVTGPATLREGIIILPKYIVDQWGTDDSVVKQFVLQELGLLEDDTIQPNSTEEV